MLWRRDKMFPRSATFHQRNEHWGNSILLSDVLVPMFSRHGFVENVLGSLFCDCAIRVACANWGRAVPKHVASVFESARIPKIVRSVVVSNSVPVRYLKSILSIANERLGDGMMNHLSRCNTVLAKTDASVSVPVCFLTKFSKLIGDDAFRSPSPSLSPPTILETTPNTPITPDSVAGESGDVSVLNCGSLRVHSASNRLGDLPRRYERAGHFHKYNRANNARKERWL